MQKITPCLWFYNEAKEAINFYVSIFNEAKIINVTRYSQDGRLPEGTLFTAVFQFEGQQFMAINGGPHHTFNDAVSLYVDCQDQQELDALWEKLVDGGEEQACGWLKVSGFSKPSQQNEAAFLAAVAEITAVTTTFLATLQTTAPAKNRAEEAAKARARNARRFPKN